jgi:hypothetical protein
MPRKPKKVAQISNQKRAEKPFSEDGPISHFSVASEDEIHWGARRRNEKIERPSKLVTEAPDMKQVTMDLSVSSSRLAEQSVQQAAVRREDFGLGRLNTQAVGFARKN